MSGIQTIVTFPCPKFNTTDSKEYFINECCFGDDLANWLIQQLRSRGFQTDPEPGQEDFGWYFGHRVGDTDYQFVIGHRPGDANDPPVWIGWVERKAGLIGSLLGARKRGIQPDALAAIHSTLLTMPQVSSIAWHLKEDFDPGKEELGKPQPTS